MGWGGVGWVRVGWCGVGGWWWGRGGGREGGVGGGGGGGGGGGELVPVGAGPSGELVPVGGWSQWEAGPSGELVPVGAGPGGGQKNRVFFSFPDLFLQFILVFSWNCVSRSHVFMSNTTQNTQIWSSLWTFSEAPPAPSD